MGGGGGVERGGWEMKEGALGEVKSRKEDLTLMRDISNKCKPYHSYLQQPTPEYIRGTQYNQGDLKANLVDITLTGKL